MGFARIRPRPRSTERSTGVSGEPAAPVDRGSTDATIFEALAGPTGDPTAEPFGRRRSIGRRSMEGRRATGAMADLIFRTVGRRFWPAADVTMRRFAFTGRPSLPAALPLELLGGEHRALAADPLRRALRVHHDAAETRADSATHVLLHRDLEEGLSSRLRRSGGEWPPGAPLPTQR